MRRSLGQPVNIENISGAGGSIGTGRVAHAAPDGYTLISGDMSTHVANGVIYSLPYDVFNDFEPIALLGGTPMLVISKNAIPATDLADLLNWLRANQDKALYGTSGVGSPSHVCGLLLQKMTGIKIQFVPYRGGGPMLQDMVAGQTDISIQTASVALPLVRGGQLKAYAVANNIRWSIAPDIPTVDESGLPGLHLFLWAGLWAPKATPKTIIKILNFAVAEALIDPTVRQRLAEIGENIPAIEQLTPEALAVHHKAEIKKWWPIIKAADDLRHGD